MSEDKTANLGITSDLSRLSGRAVESLLGEESMLLGKSGLMIEAGDAMNEFCELRTWNRVGAIGIGTDRVGRCGQSIVGDDVAFGSRPVHASFDVVDLGDRDVVEINHVSTNVAWGWFLTEEIATTGNAVGKG